VIVSEAIRNAQRLTGKKDITGDEMRRGLESLRVSEAHFRELGLPGFAAPFSVNCTHHNGHHSAYMQQWDGSKWVKVSDWIEPMKDKVMPLLDAAADYVSKNQPWPKRTEACDKSS
jgi:branched-chain amino acid transport system substrate-binding protein